MAKDGEEEESGGFTSIADLLAQQANREQSASAFADWAGTLRDYYASLIDAGFDDAQAMELVVEFQTISFDRLSET